MVFDCSMFHWEFHLLELRMRELWNVVDYFVVTESLYDHRGKPRELVLKKKKLKWAEDKLVINVSDRPEVAEETWDYERHHRRESIRAIQQFKPDPSDLILVSDMDELFRASAIKRLTGQDGIFKIHMPMYYYYFNLYVHDWFQPTVLTYRYVELLDFGKTIPIRNFPGTLIENGGWHFGYLGKEKQILNKLKTFAHDEYDTPEFANCDNIRRALESGTDLFGRGGGFIRQEIDKTWPKYLRKNKKKYKEFIL